MTTSRIRSGRAGSPRLSLTARAVRAALLASSAAVVLGASPAALAGTCVSTAPNVVTCTGVFTDNVTNSVSPADLLPDLTLIVADTSSTSASTVTPANGVVGIGAAWGGDVGVMNYADIVTTGADAINAYGSLTATVENHGNLTTHVVNAGDNALDVSAMGDVDVLVGGNVRADNAGAVDVTTVTATSLAGNLDLRADATADIRATAAAGDAYGVVTDAALDSYVTIDGDITATSVGGYAGGLLVYGDGYVDVYNTGAISASSSQSSAVGVAAYSLADGVYFYSNGNVSATAADLAVGVALGSPVGDVYAGNDGTISATSDDTAIALDLYSNTFIDVMNSGTITANGDLYSIAIDTSFGTSVDTIDNYGTINGAIYTGAGDDTLFNDVGATWNASGYSDFGDGDDTVTNAGDIMLADATVSLGGSATAAGNLFQNDGTVTVDGDSYVDVDGGGTATGLFVNDSVIDMQDGAADDYLGVSGDFAGTGDINVDVEGAAGVSDQLYIDGDVAAAADQTINVDLLDLSAPIADIIPIVGVSGTSVAGNFSLGTVTWDADNSFVDLDFGLVADIDTTNATPDVFGLGITVTGLADAGTIAASAVPGVQALMGTQVGTWRQRMGVIDRFNDGGVSLWARVFGERSHFHPEFASDDIGAAGNFDWRQRTRGVEAGVDFAVTDEFSVGLLAARTKSDLRLEDPGDADADIDADTWGLYGTWLTNNFYLDASYRWTDFDVDFDSLAGAMASGGKAETFNLEAGFAWTLGGGLKLEPQLQYTHTNVKDVDLLTTGSGMTFRTDGGESSRGRVGVALYKHFGDADTGWLVTPYGALSAVREFDGEQVFAINDTLVATHNVEGTSTLLELGLTARHGGLALYGGLNWQDGGAIENAMGGQLGVRYTFGGGSPAPAPVPVPVVPAKTCADLDDDGDGINNCDDRCPGSPAGSSVGADGCPVPAPAPEPEMAPKPYRG